MNSINSLTSQSLNRSTKRNLIRRQCKFFPPLIYSGGKSINKLLLPVTPGATLRFLLPLTQIKQFTFLFLTKCKHGRGSITKSSCFSFEKNFNTMGLYLYSESPLSYFPVQRRTIKTSIFNVFQCKCWINWDCQITLFLFIRKEITL